jgi:stage V sporulation protein G
MNEPQTESSPVSIRVLSVTPLRAGKLFALASIEIDIDGIQIAIYGIRALNAARGTRIGLPQFRDKGGALRPAITVPEELRGPIGMP